MRAAAADAAIRTGRSLAPGGESDCTAGHQKLCSFWKVFLEELKGKAWRADGLGRSL